MTHLQTPKEMLERWDECKCQCDPDVGFLCEICHDTQVVRDLIRDSEMLEFLLGQFQSHSLKMDGNHSWRFHGGWPWSSARGHTPRDAVEEAMKITKEAVEDFAVKLEKAMGQNDE